MPKELGGSYVRLKPIVAALLAGGVLVSMVATAAAEQPANSAFDRTWARTDLAVAEGVVSRTWMWGPDAISGPLEELYYEADGGYRVVQYFDKSRMEITTDPSVPYDSEWFVTNGLLAKEMITGEMQVGNSDFIDWGAAEVPIAGDVDDDAAPTYATFAGKLYVPLGYPGELITTVIEGDGSTWELPALADYGVTADEYVVETNHRVASVFWEFMISDGPIYLDGRYFLWPLFDNSYYATGYPITEAYWANVSVGGVYRDVLIQCFERRCLTYTPGNSPGFEVEAGNIGLHYYIWRYGELPPAYR
jgi:hypothetical protein